MREREQRKGTKEHMDYKITIFDCHCLIGSDRDRWKMLIFKTYFQATVKRYIGR